MSIIFGPIPSRRLGRSIGINNIPPKICSYSCVYCQLGVTNNMSIQREEFYSSDVIYEELSLKISELQKHGEHIDYLTFVPDGEPTLDINLGKMIDRFKSFGLKIAVISNASLIWNLKVQNELLQADCVSLKVDSVLEKVWKKVNRPHGFLNLQRIIDGAIAFSKKYKGVLATETMLVGGINDNPESLNLTAETIQRINPQIAYILVPTRPPAENIAVKPSEDSLITAYNIFSSKIKNVEVISGNEGTDFSFSSDVEKEIVNILSVHPMREDAVEEFLTKSNNDWNTVEELIQKEIIKKTLYSGEVYYSKNFNK